MKIFRLMIFVGKARNIVYIYEKKSAIFCLYIKEKRLNPLICLATINKSSIGKISMKIIQIRFNRFH